MRHSTNNSLPIAYLSRPPFSTSRQEDHIAFKVPLPLWSDKYSTVPNSFYAVLNGSSNILIKSKLPPGVTREQGVKMLHDKEFFINCAPHLAKYDATGEVADPVLPERAKAIGPTFSYSILDVVPNVPKAIWGSNVQSTYEFTDVENGLFCRIRSPLNVVMEALWEIRDAEDGEGLELVEDAELRCSKLLVGLVKSQCEAGGGSPFLLLPVRNGHQVAASRC